MVTLSVSGINLSSHDTDYTGLAETCDVFHLVPACDTHIRPDRHVLYVAYANVARFSPPFSCPCL